MNTVERGLRAAQNAVGSAPVNSMIVDRLGETTRLEGPSAGRRLSKKKIKCGRERLREREREREREKERIQSSGEPTIRRSARLV